MLRFSSSLALPSKIITQFLYNYIKIYLYKNFYHTRTNIYKTLIDISQYNRYDVIRHQKNLGVISLEVKKILFEPIQTGSVAKIVMERIKEAMINKELCPGDRLPTETELCESMGVGKSSVREAIKMLDVLGVVETIQGNGTYISSAIPENSLNPLIYQLLIDYGNNANIFELRSMFEPAYTLLAMKNATQKDIDRLIEVNRKFKEKVSIGSQMADDDLEFHKVILEATHNPFVIRIGLVIMQLFRASIKDSMILIPKQAVYDHDEILQAFIRHNEKEVVDAITRSFQGWISMMHKKGESEIENV